MAPVIGAYLIVYGYNAENANSGACRTAGFALSCSNGVTSRKKVVGDSSGKTMEKKRRTGPAPSIAAASAVFGAAAIYSSEQGLSTAAASLSADEDGTPSTYSFGTVSLTVGAASRAACRSGGVQASAADKPSEQVAAKITSALA